MFLVGLLTWWYSGGLIRRIQIMKTRLASSADFFSIGLLIKTLFSPYRQISAENVSGSLSVQIRAFFDKLISRIIGATVRSFIIIIGVVAIFFQTIFSIIVLIIWLFIPILPVICIILMIIGWDLI